MKIFGIHIVSNAKMKRLKGELVTFVGTEADRIVAELKQTGIGGAVIDSIEAVASEELSGAQKFERVVAEIGPLVLRYATQGGFKAALDDVEDITRQLVQSTYVSVKSKGFGKVAAQLIKLLGL